MSNLIAKCSLFLFCFVEGSVTSMTSLLVLLSSLPQNSHQSFLIHTCSRLGITLAIQRRILSVCSVLRNCHRSFNFFILVKFKGLTNFCSIATDKTREVFSLVQHSLYEPTISFFLHEFTRLISFLLQSTRFVICFVRIFITLM